MTARALLLALCLWLTGALGAAWAQPVESQTYITFEQLVQRVDRVLLADRVADERLEELRAEVDRFRELFLEEQSANADRIDRVARQLETLGPAPEEGDSEPADIASRRTALEAELATLQIAPRRASEAFVEADAVIIQIDTRLRDRQAALILERYPSPLNPLNWELPLAEFNRALLAIPREIFGNLDTTEDFQRIARNLPSAALSLILGAFLLFRTRVWSDRLSQQIDQVPAKVARQLLRVATIIADLALPLLGLGLVIGALPLTGLFGDVGRNFILAAFTFGGILIATTWLARQLFPKWDPDRCPLRIDPKRIGKARRATLAIAATVSLHHGLQVLGERMEFDSQTGAYAGFVVSIMAGTAVWRIAQLFRRSVRRAPDEDGEMPPLDFGGSFISVLGALAMVLTLVALIAGLAGYVVLAKELVFSIAWTYLLFGFLTLAQMAVRDFYALAFPGKPTKDNPEGEEGLVPTLIGALLVIASIPVLALIWGARPIELYVLWDNLRGGISIGEVRISPTELLTFVVVFALGYTVTRLMQGGLQNTILPKTRLDQGARNALVSGLGYIGVFLAGIAAISAAGINLSSLAIFASALAVGVGFGLQTIVSNFVSGIILLIERPVAEGDWIEVAGFSGYVRRISVRSTRIETFDRSDVIVPNADLVSGVVTNWTRGSSLGRVIVSVGVAYGTDTRKVAAILEEIARAHSMVTRVPPPLVLFIGFGADSLNFEIRAILYDVNYMLSVRSDLNHEIARRFAEEGIEIPFSQTDLWIRNPEALKEAAVRLAATEVPMRDHRADDLAKPEAQDFNGPDGDGDGAR